MKNPTATPVSLTRFQRAQVIRDEIFKQSVSHGRWKRFEWGEGRTARVWSIEPSSSWSAQLSTRFSLSSQDHIVMEGYDEALLLQLAPPRSDDVVLDSYVQPYGKVLSLGTTEGVDTLITMQPGPWEEMFGLERRPWTAAFARRMALNASKVSAR